MKFIYENDHYFNYKEPKGNDFKFTFNLSLLIEPNK